MAKIMLICSFCFLLSVPCFGESKQELKNVESLIKILTLDRISKSISHSVVQQGVSQHKLSVNSEGLGILEGEMDGVINAKLRVPGGYLDQAKKTYMSEFTASEIEVMLQFFSSPVGLKFIDREARLAKLGASNADAWMDVLLRDVDADFISIAHKHGVM